MLNGRIQLQAQFDETTSLDQRSGSVSAKISKTLQLIDGSGGGQASKLFAPAASPAVAQSVNTDYDLSGTLGGTFGTVAFTALKGLIVVADPANPAAITLFGGTNPFLGPLGGTTPTVSLKPGQMFCVTAADAAGWPIANGSNDNFRIATPSTAGTYSWKLLAVGI